MIKKILPGLSRLDIIVEEVGRTKRGWEIVHVCLIVGSFIFPQPQMCFHFFISLLGGGQMLLN